MLVENLRKGNEVLFISYIKQYPDFLFPGTTQFDESSEPLVTENTPVVSFWNPFSWVKAARMAAAFGPDAVIFSWVSTALALQFGIMGSIIKRRSRETRIVYLCHNVIQHESRSIDGLLTRIAFNRCDSFLVLGDEPREQLLSIIPGARVRVAEHPTYGFFAETDTDRSGARRSLGLEPGDRVGLYFGFVRPYKGLINLVRALPRITERVDPFRLLVVGEFWEDRTPYESEIEGAGLSDRVTIVDRYIPNEEVATYFAAADVVVLPYVSASASGIVQVAYGFGRPVVTTTVGALPDAVVDGKTGYLVPPGDPEAIAEAVIDFFENADPEEFRSNITDFRDRFSWGHFVDKIEDACGPPHRMKVAGSPE